MSDFFLRLLHGGPYYIFCYLMFIASTATAIVLLIRRGPLAWRLLAAISPFLFGSEITLRAGYHAAIVGSGKLTAEALVVAADGTFMFRAGAILSAVFCLLALCDRAGKRSPGEPKRKSQIRPIPSPEGPPQPDQKPDRYDY